MSRCKANLDQVQSVLAEGGDTGLPFPRAVKAAMGATVPIAKPSQLYPFAVIPKPWVVQRAFAWLEKGRRLWKNGERKLNSSLPFLHFAFLGLLLKSLGTGS